MEIYVQPFPGPGGKRQVSHGVGLPPRWRGDGRELYYLTADRKKLIAVEVKSGPTFETGATKTLFESPVRIADYDVTADGQRRRASEGTGHSSRQLYDNLPDNSACGNCVDMAL